MGPSEQPTIRSVDVTGLPEEAVQAVELYVSQLRAQNTSGVHSAFRCREDWAKAVREWAASHKPTSVSADWSRDSIYADPGE
jgi:hypothetical protein